MQLTETKSVQQWPEPELRNVKILYGIHVFLLVSAIVMPQYFGIHIGWDITCTRFANILLVLYVFFNRNVFIKFSEVVLKSVIIVPLVLYICVAGYTMVFRVDINAFMMPFLEVLTLYMMMFGIRYVIGIKKSYKLIIGCAYFLGFYGLLEFAAGRSIMVKLLKTLPSGVTSLYRSGYYRAMGPCGHALGYGLVLIILIAFACYNIETDEIFVFSRPILIMVLICNVLLTGSRSSQGIAVLELFIIFLVSHRNRKKQTLVYVLVLASALALFLLVGYKTKIGKYILLQITIMIDQIFNTSLSVNFGAEAGRLNDSENYRTFLPLIFKLDWLNPFIGRGVKRSFSAKMYNAAGEYAFIQSIDNFYVSQYIKYAYPGLFSYVAFVITSLSCLVNRFRKNSSRLHVILLIALFCYFLNLWWVDALQTLKYVYIVIAFSGALVLENKNNK